MTRIALLMIALVLMTATARGDEPSPSPSPANTAMRMSSGLGDPSKPLELPPPADLARTAQSVALFGAISLAPVALLMCTAFVRIQVVLTLVRQALGSPQVPGNQVITALALLLTLLVMAPAGRLAYDRGVAPYAEGELGFEEAFAAGSGPIKQFMVDQIYNTGHERYLADLYDYAEPPSSGRERPDDARDLPLTVVAPAFLLSELTTALWIGFLIYLPFLVVDLVTSAVLAAAGLVMLPPSQVALPLKLALFVLADGWWLLAESLLKTFAIGPAASG